MKKRKDGVLRYIYINFNILYYLTLFILYYVCMFGYKYYRSRSYTV